MIKQAGPYETVQSLESLVNEMPPGERDGVTVIVVQNVAMITPVNREYGGPWDRCINCANCHTFVISCWSAGLDQCRLQCLDQDWSRSNYDPCKCCVSTSGPDVPSYRPRLDLDDASYGKIVPLKRRRT